MASAEKDAQGETADPAPGRSSVERAHAEVRAALDELARAKDPTRMRGILDTLSRILPPHFAEEEGPGGLFEELESVRPASVHRLRSLGRQHSAILEALERLKRQIERFQRDLEEIENEKTEFVQRLRTHERTESSLVMDTYLMDDGGSG